MSAPVERLVDLLRLTPGGADADLTAAWRALASEPGIKALVKREGASLWLHRRLHQLGLDSSGPLGQSLRENAHREALIGLRIDDEASATLRTLGDAGVEVVLLKGQARRAALAHYPWADARSLSDVDILVRGDQGQRAWDLLVARGYQFAVDPNRSYDEHHHLPPIAGARGIAVEIHTSTSPWITASEAWRRETEGADRILWSGLEVTVPSATELLWHAIEHGFVHGQPSRLRSLLDGAVILASGREIDWARLVRRMESTEVREETSVMPIPAATQRAWLATAAEFAGVDLPQGLAARPLPIRRLLRWRLAVLNARLGERLKDRLLEEGSRAELSRSLAPTLPGTGLWPRLRHAVAGLTARVGYQGWRFVTAGRSA